MQVQCTYVRPCPGRALTVAASVAVFDVVRTPARTQPFVLLQPRISLEDLLPNVDLVSAAKQDRLPNLESAYVGIVEETGSLYAMSPDRYPLVVFGDANFEEGYARRVGRTIDPPPGSIGFDDDRDLPSDVDSITRAMKRRKLKELCRNGSRDKRCLTGVRELESSRLSRLLDGPPTVPYPPGLGNPGGQLSPDGRPNHSGALPTAGNASIPALPGASGRVVEGSSENFVGYSAQVLSTYAVGLVTLVAMFAWLYQRAERRSTPTPPPTSVPSPPASIPIAEPIKTGPPVVEPLAVGQTASAELPPVEVQPDVPLPETPRPKSRAVSFGEVVKVEVPVADEDEGGENGVEGDESEGEQAPTPGRRKPARRKRGKKKKPGMLSGSSEEANEEAKLNAESANEEPGTPKGEREPVHVVSPSSAIVPPPTPPTPVIPSLVVSDTILGKFVFISFLLRRLTSPQALDPMGPWYIKAPYKAARWQSSGCYKTL